MDSMTSVPLSWHDSMAVASISDSEAQLVERAKREPEAMAQLYREHRLPIARYVLRRVADRGEAEDIVAEVFLTMVRCLPRYRQRGAPFRAWLYRLATDQIGRWARRRRRRMVRQLNDEIGQQASAAQQDQAELLRLGLAALPARFQSVLSLHYLEELSIAEIAQILRCAEGTVKSRLCRGRDMLRTKLERRKDLP
jgi:RNA polymerase sigma-70 factor (ECF subfamily)